MRIGDIIQSTKVRPADKAVVVKADIEVKNREDRKQVRSKYIARYDDGSEITFYGFNINKSIFKFEQPDGQMCLDDFMTPPQEDLV